MAPFMDVDLCHMQFKHLFARARLGSCGGRVCTSESADTTEIPCRQDISLHQPTLCRRMLSYTCLVLSYDDGTRCCAWQNTAGCEEAYCQLSICLECVRNHLQTLYIKTFSAITWRTCSEIIDAEDHDLCAEKLNSLMATFGPAALSATDCPRLFA